MQAKRLVLNTALLTSSSLLMSGIGMAFQAWLVGRIGPAGIGLYQLTLSVTNLGATFAISGVRFAATRLVAEELSAENTGGVRAAMTRCLTYGSFFGLAALLILWFLAGPIGGLAIRDTRTILSLRLASLSLLSSLRVFHRLRPSLEADACPPDRTAHRHCARCLAARLRTDRGH